MKTRGWLVNDRLTCIPGTRTFWHNLLDWFPFLEDKTGHYTDFRFLAEKIETDYSKDPSPPGFLIRNATFFRPINIPAKCISFLQDIYDGANRIEQEKVISASSCTVFNSNYTMSKYKNSVGSGMTRVIPIGTDFSMFRQLDKLVCAKEMDIRPGSLLFVGSSTNHPKGFDLLMDIVESTKYDYVFVMKDSYRTHHPRIKVFNQVPHDSLVKIYNACETLVCTSKEETLHLSSVEAGACGLPVITPNLGIHYTDNFKGKIEMTPWGAIVDRTARTYLEAIEEVKRTKLDTRFAVNQYSIDECKANWFKLLQEMDIL